MRLVLKSYVLYALLDLVLLPKIDMKLANIGHYQTVGDWSYILLGILITDIIVLFVTRFYPEFFGKALNRWYDEFKLSAVISDVFIIAIGFALTRYVYSWMTDPKAPFNIPLFIGLLVGIQAIHDILFYLGIILPIPQGHNTMIDVFKEYAQENGSKILLADAAMMVSSAFFEMILKGLPVDQSVFVGLLMMYTLPYILETSHGL